MHFVDVVIYVVFAFVWVIPLICVRGLRRLVSVQSCKLLHQNCHLLLIRNLKEIKEKQNAVH